MVGAGVMGTHSLKTFSKLKKYLSELPNICFRNHHQGGGLDWLKTQTLDFDLANLD